MPAPSFTSFPPIFGSFPDLEEGPSSRLTTDEKGVDRHRGKDRNEGIADKSGRERKKKDKKKSHRDRDDGRTSRHGSLRLDRADKSVTQRRDAWNTHDDTFESITHASSSSERGKLLFFQDRKGDSLNVTFDGLHSGDIPKYWLVARGKVILGLDRKFSVLYRGSKGLEIGESGTHTKAPQLTDRRTHAMLTGGQTRQLKASERTSRKYEEVDGVIRVSFGKGKEKDQAYRSVTQDSSPNLDSESDSGSPIDQSRSSDDDDDDTIASSAREEALRNVEQCLRNDPSSISHWLQLLDRSLSNIPLASKNASKARSEISLSVIARAFSAHPNNIHSIILRLKYLRAGEELWEESQMKKEWEDALRIAGDPDIWVEWLDWQMRTGAKGFDDCLASSSRAMSHIGRDLQGADADLARLRIFRRTAIFMEQAGYVERSLALFQAQAELSFNAPSNAQRLSIERKLDALEGFWEAEGPRVGEDSARGWKNWDTGTSEHDILPIKGPHDVSKVNGTQPYRIWHQNESEADRHLMMPKRTSDMDEDDPFTTVLFSDIRPYLFPLQTTKGKEYFRLIWLSFLGLHIPGLTGSFSFNNTDDRWADISFNRAEFIATLFPHPNNRHVITAESFAGVVIGKERSHKSLFGGIKEWSLGALSPLEGQSVDGQGRMWEQWDTYGINNELVRHIFEQLDMEARSIDWRILSLASEASIGSLSSALKRSQTFLSANSSSPKLLAAHARLERINHKNSKARKIYRVGLSELSLLDDPETVHLYWDAAEFEWLLSQREAALDIILQAAGRSGERGGVTVLRAKRRLEELAHEGPSVNNWEVQFNWMRLRILLELLTGTIDTTAKVARNLQAGRPERRLEHESLTISSLLMIYHHTVTLRNPAPPSFLRNLVHEALAVYPNNTIILGLFLECEKGEGVWGRVRRLMIDPVGTLGDKSLARRIMEVWIANWEEGRWPSEIERVRAGMEAAVSSDRTKGSAILWKTFVKFEIATGDLKKAKAVLFRGLGECPLVKDLYLLAFEDDLRSAFTSRELLSLADAMAERGLRLRRSLGEVLEEHEGWDEDARVDGVVKESDDEDELEYNSRELRRLMPY